METERSHLNPGFKVVSQASAWWRTYSFPSFPRASEQAPRDGRFRAGDPAVTMAPMRAFPRLP